MARGRSLIPLLIAIVAALAVPATASAQDVTPPANTTPATPNVWLTAPYQVALSATDDYPDPVSMEWRLDGGVTNVVANGDTITITDSGDYDFETQAVDFAGNPSGWRLESLRIDTILPTDGTDPGTTAWRPTATSVTVTAADVTSGLDHVEWQLDGGSIQTGPNGSVVPISGDGSHLLRTRAVDVAGNVSVWRDHTVRVDTVLPSDTTTVTAGWHTQPVNVNVTGTDAHSGVNLVEYRLNGGSTVTTAAPGQATVSTEGVNTLETRVRDAAGNWSGWKSTQISVDTTAPTNSTAVSDGVWTTANYNVAVTGTDATSGLLEVEYRINGGAWNPVPSGTQAAISGTGDHTLETRARDKAGNTSIARLDHVRIDTVVPTNTTAPAPGGPVANPYTVPVTGTDAHAGITRVEWQVDNGPILDGASGATATVSGHGSHTFKTRVVDGAGNVSGWRSETVNIDAVTGDTTAPTDTTTAAPSGWRPGSINVTIAATDAGSGVTELRWRIDGQPMEVAPGPSHQITISGQGEHLLETMAVDLAENESAWRAQTFKIDQTVPQETTAIPADWHNARTFTLAATDAHSGVADIEYRINGGTLQHGTPGQVVDVGADGTFSVWLRAIDAAGHASLPRTVAFKVDTVLPVNTSAAAPSGWQTAAVELALSGTDAGSGLQHMQWRLDNGDTEDGSPAVIDTDGSHTLETRAVDKAGNVSAWRSETVEVDANAPENTTPAAPAAWRNTPYSVQVTGDDGDGSGIAAYESVVDGGAPSTDPNVTIAADGVHTLSTRIVDNVGHASTWRDETVRIDTVAPAAALDCGDGAWSRTAVSCTPAASDALSGIATLTLNGSAVGSGAAVPVTGDGNHTLVLHAADAAGNTAAAQAAVNIDSAAPHAALSCSVVARKHVCAVDGSDALSGLTALGYSVDGGEWTAIAPGGTFTVDKGKVRVRAADAAGNENVTAPATLAAQPKPGTTVRIASAPVYLKGHRDADSLVGALDAARSSNGTVSLDLRPLAVGRGTYRVVVKLKSGKRKRTFDRRYKVGRTGTLPRIATSLSKATKRTTVTLTVKKRVGGKWRKHAGTRLVLAK